MTIDANKLDIIVVFCTCPSTAAAELARQLVSQRLAACVNIAAGLQSIYQWQEQIEIAEESLLIIKTAAARWDDLQRQLLNLHPYKLPEIIALPVSNGLPEYLAWVVAETKSCKS